MIPESSPRGYHWACWKGSCRCRSKWCWKWDLPSKVGPEASCLLDLTYESWSIMELLFFNRVPLQTFTFCHHVPSRVDMNGICSVLYFPTLPYAAIFMVQMTINHKILGCFWGFSGEWSLITCQQLLMVPHLGHHRHGEFFGQCLPTAPTCKCKCERHSVFQVDADINYLQ